jgi:hypothetical protein
MSIDKAVHIEFAVSEALVQAGTFVTSMLRLAASGPGTKANVQALLDAVDQHEAARRASREASDKALADLAAADQRIEREAMAGGRPNAQLEGDDVSADVAEVKPDIPDFLRRKQSA